MFIFSLWRTFSLAHTLHMNTLKILMKVKLRCCSKFNDPTRAVYDQLLCYFYNIRLRAIQTFFLPTMVQRREVMQREWKNEKLNWVWESIHFSHSFEGCFKYNWSFFYYDFQFSSKAKEICILYTVKLVFEFGRVRAATGVDCMATCITQECRDSQNKGSFSCRMIDNRSWDI